MQAACGSCLHEPPAFDACQVLADYDFPWNRLIANLKFGGQPDLARPLADALASRLVDAGHTAGIDLLIPIPMGPFRLSQRGYNQAWELARHMARLCRIEAASDCLIRWRETPPQSGLGRVERERNLRDALAVQPHWAQRLAGRHVALVDDVLTTGVTAESAAQALRQCGVRRIDVWVVARTPAPAD